MMLLIILSHVKIHRSIGLVGQSFIYKFFRDFNLFNNMPGGTAAQYWGGEY